jgi:hypothetical protein
MKTSFSSNDQLCHVWAQQTQSSGKANNMFFEGSKIYSYGFHYLAAQIHTVQGQKICLVRSDSYSNTTTKHLYAIENAVNGLMPVYRVPFVNDLYSEKNFNHFNDIVLDEVERILKSVKVVSFQNADSWARSLQGILSDANEFFRVTKNPEISINKDMWDIICGHLNNRVERYVTLNTPEMIQKREAALHKKKLVKTESDIKEWRQSGTITNNLKTLPYELLRVSGFVVKTSRGAEVPLSHALRLLGKIERKEVQPGDRIGHFTFENITGENQVIKIGCHKILLSEAKEVLAPFRDQEIKEA